MSFVSFFKHHLSKEQVALVVLITARNFPRLHCVSKSSLSCFPSIWIILGAVSDSKNAIQAHSLILLVVLEIRVQTLYLHYKYHYKVLGCFNLSPRIYFCYYYYSCLKCFILMLTVVTVGTHSSTNPTRGLAGVCFLSPDAVITWMTLKHKQATRCAHNLVALLVEGSTWSEEKGVSVCVWILG